MSKHAIHRRADGVGISAVSGNVHELHFDDVRKGWEQYVLLSSDRHHDNAHCDHALEKRHLDEARARGAVVLDFGDLFCAMQGYGDKRASKAALRMENKNDDYLDSLVETAADFYSPYADLFGVIGTGNHESALLKRCGMSLTRNLVKALNLRNAESSRDWRVQAGGYGGWVRFRFTIRKTVKSSLNLKYFHGAGGGGPVTRGVIQTNRQAVYLPDADIVVNGHTHDGWILPISRERINSHGNISQDVQWHLRCPSYKDEYGDGSGGWHVETWKPPKPLGAVWMRFWLDDDTIRSEASLALK